MQTMHATSLNRCFVSTSALALAQHPVRRPLRRGAQQRLEPRDERRDAAARVRDGAREQEVHDEVRGGRRAQRDRLLFVDGLPARRALLKLLQAVVRPAPLEPRDVLLDRAQVRRALETIGGAYTRYVPTAVQHAARQTPAKAGPVLYAHLALARRPDVSLARRQQALGLVSKLVAQTDTTVVAQPQA